MKSGKGKVALITLNFPFTIWKTWDNILRFSGKVIENTTIKTASYREVIIRIPLSPPKKDTLYSVSFFFYFTVVDGRCIDCFLLLKQKKWAAAVYGPLLTLYI